MDTITVHAVERAAFSTERWAEIVAAGKKVGVVAYSKVRKVGWFRKAEMICFVPLNPENVESIDFINKVYSAVYAANHPH